MKTNPEKIETLMAKAEAEGKDPYKAIEDWLRSDPRQFRKFKNSEACSPPSSVDEA